MKNIEYEKNFYLDILNNIHHWWYNVYWYDLYLNWKRINTFTCLYDLVKFLSIYTIQVLKEFNKL